MKYILTEVTNEYMIYDFNICTGLRYDSQVCSIVIYFFMKISLIGNQLIHSWIIWGSI